MPTIYTAGIIIVVAAVSFWAGSLATGSVALSTADVDNTPDQSSTAMDGMGEMDMNPTPVEVEVVDQVPQVRIVEAFAGMMGEYTIRIETEHFTFTPENIDQAPIQNEGHGHVYVNNQRAGRVYGEWVYIPGHYFVPGENKITVSLNANTHGPWLFSDAPIEATRFVTY